MANHYPRRKPRRKKIPLGLPAGSDKQKRQTEDLITEFPTLNEDQKALMRKMGFVAADKNAEVRTAAEKTIAELRSGMAAQLARSDLSWGSKTSLWDAFDTPEAQAVRPQINRMVIDQLDRALDAMEMWIENTDWNKYGVAELRKGIELEIENSHDILRENLLLEPVVQGEKSTMSPKAEEFLDQFNQIVGGEARDAMAAVPEPKRQQIFKAAVDTVRAELAQLELALSPKFR